MTVHLNIGSNCGHRRTLIERAVAALSGALPGRMRLYGPVESEPWGFSSPNRFLNLGVVIDLPDMLDPIDILDITQSIQDDIDPAPHRDANGAYIDRSIDIDIIAVDRIIMRDPRLTLPHPRAHERDFVMNPLRALDPLTADWLLTLS